MNSVNTTTPGLNPGLQTAQLLSAQLSENLQNSTQGAQLLGAVSLSANWMKELISSVIQLNQKDKSDGVTDTHGAPVLEAPVTDFSGDQLALILAALDIKIKEAQGKTAKEGIEAARQQTESANKRMIDKLQEVIDKQKEAAEKEKEYKVWGWIGKIAAVIGAIVGVIVAAVATVASGGAAAPLLILATVGLVAATVDLASQINKEIHPDAKPFTLGSLIGDAIVKALDDAGISGDGRTAASSFGAALGFLLMQPDLAGQMAGDAAKANGASEADIAKITMGVQIAAVVTSIVLMIAVTVASGGGSAAQGISSTVKNLMTAAKVMGAVAEIIRGSSGVAQGAIGIEVAGINQDADKSRAAAKKIEAILAQLQAQSEEQTARLKEIIEALDEGMAQFSQMVAAAGDQRANQVKNLVRA